MAVSRLDDVYIMCRRLIANRITSVDFVIWGLEYFTKHAVIADEYGAVRAVVIESIEVDSVVIRETVEATVLEIEKKTSA